jgi:DNA (cytosine-5)-methyltransferase 1
MGVFVRETTSAASSSSKKSRLAQPLKNGPIKLPDKEIDCYSLSKGCMIVPGDTVELKDTSSLAEGTNHSGDFLRVKHIIMNFESGEVRLRGLRLRRTKYLQQMFDCKYIMFLKVHLC